MQKIHLRHCKGWALEPALTSLKHLFHPQPWLWAGTWRAKLNSPTVQRRISHLQKWSQSKAGCVTRGMRVVSTQRPGRSWKRMTWAMHLGFQLRGSLNAKSLLLQKATDVLLLFLASSYLYRHHRDTVHNTGLFELSARNCDLTPDRWWSYPS